MNQMNFGETPSGTVIKLPPLPGKVTGLYRRLIDVADEIKELRANATNVGRRAKRATRHLLMIDVEGVTDVLYRHHSLEMLNRALNGDDLRTASRAEVLMYLNRKNQSEPLNRVELALYAMLSREICGQDSDINYEEPWPGSADELFIQLGTHLMKEWRSRHGGPALRYTTKPVGVMNT